ncbi:MAG: linear amide C-N hydrolase [Planctomycetota bacterium]
MQRLIQAAFAAAIITISIAETDACSRVLWNNNGKAVVTGRTMDWSHTWNDVVFIYPRGQEMDGGVEGGLKWKSKFGSVGCSISPYAKKYGFDYVKDGHSDGINEEGLAAHLLYLEETVYPDPKTDDRPAVTFMRWVRYILDNFATVEEAVAGMKNIRIAPVSMGGKVFGVHVAVEDPTGDSAIFEYINGNLVIHHGKQFTVMTNDPSYPYHVENIKNYKDFGGEKDLPGTTEPDDRFVRLAHFLGRLKQPETDAEALAKIYSVIKTAHVPFDADEYGPTWWTSLTDCTNKVWYFDWSQNPNIIWIDLKKLDFSAGKPVLELNPRNPAMVGDVTSAFTPINV